MPTDPEPGDPFPTPAETPVPPERPRTEPNEIPQPGPDIIDPGTSPGVAEPPAEIPGMPGTL